jgi:hypothetical protein
MSVMHDFGDEWTSLMTVDPDPDEQKKKDAQTGVTEADRDAIVHHGYGQIISGDLGDGKTLAPIYPDQPADKKGGPVQGGAQYGTQYAMHWLLKSLKPNTPRVDKTEQLQFTLTYQGHPEDKGGVELQGQMNLSYNTTTGDVVPAPGAQASVVQVFNKLKVQISEFVGVVGGVAINGGQASGQLQVQVGAQAVIDVGGWKLGVQAAATGQAQDGQKGDVSGGVTGFVQKDIPLP